MKITQITQSVGFQEVADSTGRTTYWPSGMDKRYIHYALQYADKLVARTIADREIVKVRQEIATADRLSKRLPTIEEIDHVYG